MGSGKILKQAYKKYGIENFKKIILETCSSNEELNLREAYWINSTNAINDPDSYNLVNGGTGGDRSMFIPYNNIDYSNHKMNGTKQWFHSLSKEEQQKFHSKQGESRSKGWYVSRIDNPTEIYVQNIAKWCLENGVDTSIPTKMNTPGNAMFQKQSKGWRIRREGMPALEPYKNLQGKLNNPNRYKNKTWKIIDGKRVWIDK
jgi:hypothetical protein